METTYIPPVSSVATELVTCSPAGRCVVRIADVAGSMVPTTPCCVKNQIRPDQSGMVAPWNPRRANPEWIEAAVGSYRRHVEPTDDELDRLEAVMYLRTLYLVCFGYRRAVENGVDFDEWWFIEPPEYFTETAAATRAAFRRRDGVGR